MVDEELLKEARRAYFKEYRAKNKERMKAYNDKWFVKKYGTRKEEQHDKVLVNNSESK